MSDDDLTAAVRTAIAGYRDPYLGRSLAQLGFVEDVRIEDGTAVIDLRLGYAAGGMLEEIRKRLSLQFADSGLADLLVRARYDIPAPQRPRGTAVRGVKHVVAVASGKGGVGKSTTAVNLALALAEEGARVGLLDADVYGPSLGVMLGIAEGRRPEVIDEQWFEPIRACGIEAISMSMLVDERTPMVWRGPMASGALQQLLTQTAWSAVDYLIVDMPPGTGDIQLTLSQKAAVSGAVIVTTPQDIALSDARKGIEMFRKVDVPVLGVVENMSIYICPACGHAEHLFGAGGGQRISEEYGVALLGALPLSLAIREDADSGRPSVAANPESDVSLVYREIARQVGAELFKRAAGDRRGPVISVVDD